jgi:type II secretory pathway component PulF
MARFRYIALDRAGKQITGEIAAENPDEVKRRLREMGYFPSRIGEAAEVNLGRPSQARRRRAISGTDVVVMTRQLADMTAARLPMFRSLSVLVDQAESSALRELVEQIRADVQQGRPLSEALARHPRHFPICTPTWFGRERRADTSTWCCCGWPSFWRSPCSGAPRSSRHCSTRRC